MLNNQDLYIALDYGSEHLREFWESKGATVYYRWQLETNSTVTGTTALTLTVPLKGTIEQ